MKKRRKLIEEVKSMEKLNDGCADAICSTHGFLASIIRNSAAAFCLECRRWIHPESNELHNHRERERKRKLAQRERDRLAA